MIEVWDASIELFGTTGTALLICFTLFVVYIGYEIYTDQSLK